MQITPLDAFNAIVPKDGGSRLLAGGVAYGRLPRQRLDIYAPRADSGFARPVVVFFYGGSWSSGDRHGYGFVGRALAALGYIAVIPDYRLLPEIEYPDFLADCADAVAWVSDTIQTFGGDYTTIALAGHSAGAYNAAMLALDSGLLARRGLMDGIRGIVGLSGPYDFFPFDGPISLRVFGGVPQPRLTQPVAHVRAGLPPMWFGHGDKDELVLPRNSDALAAALTERGGRGQVRYYPHLGHAGTLLALSRPLRWRAPVLADLAAFLSDCLDPA